MTGSHSPSRDALDASQDLQDRVSRRGFDWSDVRDVVEKVREELDEVLEALGRNDTEHARRELGDVLFASVNLARFLDTRASGALHTANERFESRFLLMETELERQGRRMEECTLDELDVVWEQVKRSRA